jgi:hypothetical protein
MKPSLAGFIFCNSEPFFFLETEFCTSGSFFIQLKMEAFVRDIKCEL